MKQSEYQTLSTESLDLDQEMQAISELNFNESTSVKSQCQHYFVSNSRYSFFDNQNSNLLSDLFAHEIQGDLNNPTDDSKYFTHDFASL